MSDLPPTRQSLLIELGKRSDLAWSEFLDIYEQAIVRYCIGRGLQEADARDAAQDIYAAISQRMTTWDHDRQGSFRAWLFRVARNISVDLIASRAKQAHGQLTDDVFNQVPTRVGEEASTAFGLQWHRALFDWASLRARQEVKPMTWRAFCLTAIEGQTAEDVSTELGISIGSVYTAKCRVMARIREHVARWDSETAPPLSPSSMDSLISQTNSDSTKGRDQ